MHIDNIPYDESFKISRLPDVSVVVLSDASVEVLNDVSIVVSEKGKVAWCHVIGEMGDMVLKK